jgi:hypothetical protein
MGIIEHRTPLPGVLDIHGIYSMGTILVIKLNRMIHECNR